MPLAAKHIIIWFSLCHRYGGRSSLYGGWDQKAGGAELQRLQGLTGGGLGKQQQQQNTTEKHYKP